MNGAYGKVIPAICVRKRTCKGRLAKAPAKSMLETYGKTTRRKASRKNPGKKAR